MAIISINGGVAGANPFDWLELIRHTPQGSVFTYQTVFRLSYPLAAIAITLGQHVRAGIEENIWDVRKGERLGTTKQIEKYVRIAQELGRPIATPEEARQILKNCKTCESFHFAPLESPLIT